MLDNYAVLASDSEEMSGPERRDGFGDLSEMRVPTCPIALTKTHHVLLNRKQEETRLRSPFREYDRIPAGSLASPFYTDHDSLLLSRVLA